MKSIRRIIFVMQIMKLFKIHNIQLAKKTHFVFIIFQWTPKLNPHICNRFRNICVCDLTASKDDKCKRQVYFYSLCA